jgi:RNA recognition motif-containing protein
MNDPTGIICKQLIGNHIEINGKYVDIKVAEDGKTREKVEMSSCKIFVGGIEGTVSTEELKDFFSNFGEVKEAVVLKNIQTNASRGFGFVTFEDSRIADQLIRENNCVLKGKRMDVKPAEPKENSAPRTDRGGMRGGYDHMNDRGGDMRHRDYGPPQVDYQPRHRGGGGSGGYQRGFAPREEYSRPEPSYAPPQYDHYSAPMVSQNRYGGYNAPEPAPVVSQNRYGGYSVPDSAPVATIAPYAPPSKTPYQSNYIQPQVQPQQQMYGGYGAQPSHAAHSGHGGHSGYSSHMGRESKVHMDQGYPRQSNPKEPMYNNKGYSSGGHQNQSYGAGTCKLEFSV